jgi:DNA-binding response OmpR family regulator
MNSKNILTLPVEFARRTLAPDDDGGSMRIALLDDEPDQAALVIQSLTAAGHVCHQFSRGIALLQALRRQTFDLLVLDWVPDMSGDDLLTWVRHNMRERLPVIFVSARGREDDIASILNAGADDYVVKPVSAIVLHARISALLRRIYRLDPEATRMTFGDFEFDLPSEGVLRRGVPVQLKKREFELALLLFQNMGRPLSRMHILEMVWKHADDAPSRTMDTHVSVLRTKLGLRPENGFRLATVYGYGYRLEQVVGKRESPIAEVAR